MKSPQFAKFMAETLCREEKTVLMFVRNLREAGLLTSGARGINAPDMTTLDAARLTIALMATNKPAEAVKRTKQFGQMEFHSSTFGSFPEELIGGEIFEEALNRYLSVYFNFETEEAANLVAANPLDITIDRSQFSGEFRLGFSKSDGRISFGIEGYHSVGSVKFLGHESAGYHRKIGGIRETCYIAPVTLNWIARVLAADGNEAQH